MPALEKISLPAGRQGRNREGSERFRPATRHEE